MAPWAEKVSTDIAKSFTIGSSPLDQLVGSLKTLPVSAECHFTPCAPTSKQHRAGYLTELFAGAAVNWDIRYFQKTARGRDRARSHQFTVPEWNIGAYTESIDSCLTNKLQRDIRNP